ncbi:hypothetical protein EC9_53180 [Rosistilla ulvae]|uniref:Uncharacterized protein n=1 Tax=Rosistilla ulvae TaxID=1930277 RepID=A0A517M876_9BACT|nr:RICIN domain-containing protein [Rosistilla ulvae]QDS91098.1 hypothetical protein EC9_53180 [Rosistilla ulvae]
MLASSRSIVLLSIIAFVFAGVAGGQTYDLAVPGSSVHSTARFVGDQLVIVDAQGDTSVYDRNARYDASGYVAYASRTLRQAIRWPVGGAGKMQVAALGGTSASVQFRPSEMVVTPRGNPGGPHVANFVPLPGVANPVQPAASNPSNDPQSAYVLESALGRGLLLSVTPRVGAGVRLGTQATDGQNVLFRFLPTDNGYVYIVPQQSPNLAIGMAAAVGRNPGRAQLYDLRLAGGDATQFRIVPGNSGFVTLELRADRDYVIDVDRSAGIGRGANVHVFTRHGLQNQLFRVERVGGAVIGNRPQPGWSPSVAVPLPASRVLVSERVEPYQPLEPVRVQLSNSHENELWVLVTNLRDPADSQRLKIPPGEARSAIFRRDAGSRVVSVFEVQQPGGLIVREESVVEVAPQPLYDVSVYELAAQSIYIDRTRPGSSPEIQRAPRSVGAFQVPATFEGGRSDVYQAAKRRNNSGGVRRLNLKDWD